MSVTPAGHPTDVDGDAGRSGTVTQQESSLKQIDSARWVGVRFIQMYTFFAAPAKDDLALLAIVYLVFVEGKTAGQVGSLQALRDFGVAIGSVGAGYIIDKSNHKLAIAAVANMTSILGVIILLCSADMGALYFRALITGLGSSFIGPARNTLALGLVGREFAQSVVSKSEAFDHAGAVGFGTIMAFLAYHMYPNLKWTFLTIVGTGLLVEISLLGFQLRASHLVSHSRASESSASGAAAPLGRVLRQPSVILYCMTVFFIHVSNAPVRMLVGQVLAGEDGVTGGRESLPLASAALVIAEFASMVGAWFYTPVWKKLGDRGMIYLGAVTLALRCMMCYLLVTYMDVTTPAARALLLSTQVLDGIGHGIWVTNQMSVMRTIGAGSGRFGFLSGLAHFSHMCGATTGQAVGGVLADESFGAAFLTSTFVPALSCICITGVVMDSPWKDTAPVDETESPQVDGLTPITPISSTSRTES